MNIFYSVKFLRLSPKPQNVAVFNIGTWQGMTEVKAGHMIGSQTNVTGVIVRRHKGIVAQ